MGKLLLTAGFTEKVIGDVTIFDQEILNLTEQLSSGQFTFASRFRKEENGDLTLLELSLIPIATLSTVDFRLLNQKDSKKIFGVDSIFVDWNVNNVEKEVNVTRLREAIENLHTSIMSLQTLKDNPKHQNRLKAIDYAVGSLREKISTTLIQLAIVGVEYLVSEDTVADQLHSLHIDSLDTLRFRQEYQQPPNEEYDIDKNTSKKG